MTYRYRKPSEIEKESLRIIRQELEAQGIVIPQEHQAVVERVIHTSADFDYAKNLVFTEGAVQQGIAALQKGTVIVTDTNMAKAGISSSALSALGGTAVCYMADPEVAAKAGAAGTTRADASVRHAATLHPGAVFAVGNAPTALYALAEEIVNGLRPALIIAVPVGFVNVVEAKEAILSCCRRHGIPAIAAMGRKGGSTIAAAICNALLYEAADMADPGRRGWK